MDIAATISYYQGVVLDCPLCGGRLVVAQCKLVCPACHVIVENCNGD